MTSLLRAAGLAAGICAAPALAHSVDLSDMSAEERAAFRDEVRAFLLDNPEVLMEAMQVLEERQAAAQAQADAALIQANAEAIFETGDGPNWVGGNPEGDITLVEFIDYRCSYCRRAHPEVQELIESDGNIRVVVKEFPILGEQSVLASRFAIATRMVEGDAAYKQMHDALITMRGEMNELSLELLAEELGFDAEAITARMQDEEVADIIRANYALAETLEINGTPSYVLGDQMVRGYVPLEGMRALVEEERGDG
jgi:protein-disulfide isomerase